MNLSAFNQDVFLGSNVAISVLFIAIEKMLAKVIISEMRTPNVRMTFFWFLY